MFCIDQLIFAAADVDRQRFIDSVKLTRAFSNSRTLYASETDRALQASGYGNAMIRAGNLPPVTIAADTDTIEVPQFDFDVLGHSYFATSRPVLEDMYVLMHYGTSVENRQGMEEKTLADGSYWRLT